MPSLDGISDHMIRRTKPMLNISFACEAHPALLLVGQRQCADPRPSGFSREKKAQRSSAVGDCNNRCANKIYTASATEMPRQVTAALACSKLCAADLALSRDKVEERSTIAAPPSLMVTGRHGDPQ
jgi:hypothetical protein